MSEYQEEVQVTRVIKRMRVLSKGNQVLLVWAETTYTTTDTDWKPCSLLHVSCSFHKYLNSFARAAVANEENDDCLCLTVAWHLRERMYRVLADILQRIPNPARHPDLKRIIDNWGEQSMDKRRERIMHRELLLVYGLG